jgi:hypothetical protein
MYEFCYILYWKHLYTRTSINKGMVLPKDLNQKYPKVGYFPKVDFKLSGSDVEMKKKRKSGTKRKRK